MQYIFLTSSPALSAFLFGTGSISGICTLAGGLDTDSCHCLTFSYFIIFIISS